jgi:hypothetical protein
VVAISFAKSTAITTNMGTMQIKRLDLRCSRSSLPKRDVEAIRCVLGGFTIDQLGTIAALVIGSWTPTQ